MRFLQSARARVTSARSSIQREASLHRRQSLPGLCWNGFSSFDRAMRRHVVVPPMQSFAAARVPIVILDGTSSEALQTHHCARLVAQAEKTATTLFALSRGVSQPLASFASLRIRARSLSPLWQPGSNCHGDSRLAGYRVAFDVAKSKMGTPGKTASFEVYLADVAGSWPMPLAEADDGKFENVCAV